MSTETKTAKREIGQVKWFNSKAGYGFITMKNDVNEEIDVFAHYSTVKVDNTQYKYLIQGEYVEFELADSTNTNHKFQASNITGIQGGKLMCETRQQYKTQQKKERSTREKGDEEFTKVTRKKDRKNTPSTAAVATTDN